jgi:hypothetical protein
MADDRWSGRAQVGRRRSCTSRRTTGGDGALAAGARALLLDECCAAQAAIDGPGAKVLRSAGDVTKVWFETIDLAWRKCGFVPGASQGPDALRIFVRRGIGAVPAFRKSELTDADIEAVFGYIAATARQTTAASN